MNPESINENVPSPEEEKAYPREKLQVMTSHCDQIKQTILEIKMMLDEADDQKINVYREFLNLLVDKYESQMAIMRGAILDIKSNIASNGLLMTREQMEARLSKDSEK